MSNGLKVEVVDQAGTVLLDFLDGSTIKANHQWTQLAGTDNPITAAAGDDEFSVRWTLSSGLGDQLSIGPTEDLRATVQDDLSAMTYFRIMVQGVYVS